MIQEIDEKFLEALWAVKKRQDIWELWAEWGLPIKCELEEEIRQKNPPYFSYLYSYWHNRNQMLELNLKSRIGLVTKKKDLWRSGRILREILLGELEPTWSVQRDIQKRVDLHLKQLEGGRYDQIGGRKVICRKKEQVEATDTTSAI